jgi:hypothetical protein
LKNASNKHIICRQVLDLKFPRSAPAFEWQHAMSRYHQHHLSGLLEKACNELCGEDETIQLDTVTIDLGMIRLKDLKAGTCDADIYALLLEQLQQQIPPAVRVSARAVGSIRLSVVRQWLYYMRKGYLPWNTLKADQAWYHHVLEALATDHQAVTLFRELLLHEKVVLQRVVKDHPPAFLVQLVEILTATRQEELLVVMAELGVCSSIAEEVSNPDKPGTITYAKQQEIWQHVFTIAAGKEGKGMTTLQLATVYIQRHLAQEFHGRISEAVMRQLIVLTPLIQAAKVHPTKVSMVADASVEQQPPREDVYQLVKSASIIPQDGIFLINAGVVLLHPFLHTFFKKLQLQLQEPADQEKALYLIHYLATGETATPEHALVVPKLLLDWPLEKNLAHETVLTPEECAAADALLEAVIGHWDKLQNAGIAALRGSFLQRNGKVFTHNEQTYIQVEQQALDILLDYLPWSISHIKLPWMKSILRIEWR